MTVTEELVPEAEAQRAILEKKLRAELEKPLPNVNIEKDENGNLKYKNLGEHVLPLLRILELELKASLVYSSKNTSNDLCPGLGLHGVEIFDSNNYRQRDRTCLPDTDTHRIRNATD